jgi:hypothetical protein
MHGASSEFITVLKKGRGTSAHEWAEKAHKTGDWDMRKHGMSGFAKNLYMGDVKRAESHTLNRHEIATLEKIFSV